MPKICRLCSAENRDEAAFCRGCGAPLKKTKGKTGKTAAQAEHEKKIRDFWIKFFSVAAIAALALFILISKRNFYKSVKVYNDTMTKYADADDRVFGTVRPAGFKLEGLSWNMTKEEIKRVYPYAAESKDPDFLNSLSVSQHDLVVFIPNAKFMSLGLANEKLYAVKFEFGPMEEAPRQQLKVPNKDEIMYGRFRGLYKKFMELYGTPSFEKFEVRDMELSKMIKTIKNGKLKSGAPSNIYVTWVVGDTKAELVMFGSGGELHLTIRFLYLPVWDIIGK